MIACYNMHSNSDEVRRVTVFRLLGCNCIACSVYILNGKHVNARSLLIKIVFIFRYVFIHGYLIWTMLLRAK